MQQPATTSPAVAAMPQCTAGASDSHATPDSPSAPDAVARRPLQICSFDRNHITKHLHLVKPNVTTTVAPVTVTGVAPGASGCCVGVERCRPQRVPQEGPPASARLRHPFHLCSCQPS